MRHVAGHRSRAIVGGLAVALLLAACGIANPPPGIPPSHETKEILLLGDSLLYQAAPRIPPNLAFHGMPAHVENRATPGAGLLDPGIIDRLTNEIDQHPDSDLVVIEYTGNCFTCPVVYGSPQFYDLWFASAQRLVDVVKGRGMTPVWVVHPPADPVLGAAPVILQLSERGRTFAVANNLVIADWRVAFTDVLGNYLPMLWYAVLFDEPTWHVVRSDGLHFTDDGIQRAALWTVAGLRNAWDEPPPPTTAPTTSTTTTTVPPRVSANAATSLPTPTTSATTATTTTTTTTTSTTSTTTTTTTTTTPP